MHTYVSNSQNQVFAKLQYATKPWFSTRKKNLKNHTPDSDALPGFKSI